MVGEPSKQTEQSRAHLGEAVTPKLSLRALTRDLDKAELLEAVTTCAVQGVGYGFAFVAPVFMNIQPVVPNVAAKHEEAVVRARDE